MWILVIFIFSMLREGAQLCLDGLEYFEEFWNWFDLGSLASFILGYAVRYNESLQPPSAWHSAMIDPFEKLCRCKLWSFMYALSIFCCWWRALRIAYMSPVGIHVSIFFKMFKDVFYFIVIYFILMLSFAMMFVGVDDNLRYTHRDCSADVDDDGNAREWSDPHSDLYMSCERQSYWVFRTVYQSFGEFFLEEAHSQLTVVILAIAFLILNIMLMNLLIAMMSSTYDDIRDKARLQRLIDR